MKDGVVGVQLKNLLIGIQGFLVLFKFVEHISNTVVGWYKVRIKL